MHILHTLKDAMNILDLQRSNGVRGRSPLALESVDVILSNIHKTLYCCTIDKIVDITIYMDITVSIIYGCTLTPTLTVTDWYSTRVLRGTSAH